jgi:hypothetical protein
MVYDVKVTDIYGNNEILLSTTEKGLAEATLVIVKNILKPKSSAVLCIKNEKENPFIWWYEDNFTLKFLKNLWGELQAKGFDPSYLS